MNDETVKLRYPLLDCCGETPMIFRDTIAKMLCITCVKCGESVHAKPEETIQQLAERWNAAMLKRRVSETVDETEELDRWADDDGAINEDTLRESADPLSYQVGGSHYKDLEYQPIEFFEDLHLDAFRANVIKYLARWRKKGGAEDLKKALHYAQIWRQNWDKQIHKMTIFANQFPGPENEIIIKVVACNPPSVVADIEHMILEYEEGKQ